MKGTVNQVETVIKLSRFDLPKFLRWVLVLIVYLITFSVLDQLTQTLQLFPGVVAWYPPDGLSLAFLLTFGAGFTPAFTLASLISSLIIYRFSAPLGQILVWAVILSVVYGIDALLLRRRVRIDPQLKNLRDTLWLILTSAIVSTVLAVISVSTLINYGEVPASQYFNASVQWWIGEMIGVLVFAPFLLIHVMPWLKRFIDGEWANSKKRTVFRRPSFQTIGQVISIPVILYLVFGIPALRSFQPLYLIAGPLIWIALTNGFSRVTLAIIVMNFGTILAIWLFKFDTTRLGELQFLMFGIYASTLLTGSIVTKQKRTEEDLRQREIRNRALIENAPDAITLLGADGLLKYLSPSTQRILGYAPEEQVGSNPAEFTHPDDLPALLKLLDDLSQKPGKVATIQYRFRHKDGSWRWLESTITNLLAEPSVQAIVFNFRDITERKQADETLRKSEKRFRALVEHSLEEISLVDPDGTLTYESPTSRRPLGYPPNSFVGHNLFDLFHPDERAAATRLLEQIVKHPGSVQEALFRLRHQDGSWRWMEGVLTNLLDEPTVQSLVINYRDITERKLAEQEIASLAKFPSENPNPVLRLCRDGIVMYANVASGALLGMWGCVVGGTAPQFWRDLTTQVLASGENKTVDIECDMKVYSMVITPIAELDYVNLYGRDITERKQAEETLHDSREELYRLLNSIVEGAYGVDTNGNCTFVNRAFLQILGFQNDQEVLGKHIHELIHHSHYDGSPYPSSECRIYFVHQNNQPINVIDEVFWRKDGVAIPVEYWSHPILKDDVGIGSITTFIEITERKQAEEALHQAEMRYRALVEQTPAVIYTVDPRQTDFFTYVSQQIEALSGYSPQAWMADAQLWNNLIHPEDRARVLAEDILTNKTGAQLNIEYRLVHRDGHLVWVHEEARLLRDASGQPTVWQGLMLDITERKRVEGQMARLNIAVNNSGEAIFMTDREGIITFVNPGFTQLYGYTADEIVGKTTPRILKSGVLKPEDYAAFWQILLNKQVVKGELTNKTKDGSLLNIESWSSPILNQQEEVIGFLSLQRDITLRKQREEEIRSRTDELTTLYKLSRALADANDLENVFELVNRHAVESVHITFACIALLEDGDLVTRAVYPVRSLEHDFNIGGRRPIPALPCCQHVLEQNEPVILHAGSPEVGSAERTTLLLDFAQSVCLVPLHVGDTPQGSSQALGLLILGEARGEKREPFTPEKVHLARSIGDQAAAAIRRLLLREEAGHRLQHLASLSEIDRTIASNFDLHLSLRMILQHVIEQLEVDAADVLVFNERLQTLEFTSGRGFRSTAIERKRLRLGEGQAGQAALERRIVQIPDFAASGAVFAQPELLEAEHVAAYFAVPLITKGRVKGVMEIYRRTPLEPNKEWLDFLNTLAGQAAIAIDVVQLFDSLQRSNTELALAYDATIEGWSHALDLRDKETEGHTQRVTEMTVKLARTIGLGEDELVQVRRGALLHDIGKMGVPDGILLKPGPLTDEEWVVMKKHPVLAYEMLSPIRYLHAALDIPYCHHEKWDGTGYPRGLKGEQIPLTARIFAVVDVWDALTSDRPYRQAWSEEKVRQHIQAGAGTHFDPQVVKICFESGLLKSQNIP